MSPERQRIAIAEACEWKFHPESDISTPVESAHPECWTHDEHGKIFSLPDYLNDLNAMHEAFNQVIKPNSAYAKRFGEILQQLVGCHCVGIVPDYNRDLRSLAFLANATATQLAETFIRTLNKWEDA